MENIKLTEWSTSGGCGCKISPSELKKIVKCKAAYEGNEENLYETAQGLIIGCGDDGAVFHIGDGKCIISTIDFFMPIVDDPFLFGKIAACNAISDIYAMGGKPIMAISVLAWPKEINKYAGAVMNGAQEMCKQCDIQIGGGHSIMCQEPIFGLSVNGLVEKECIATKSQAKPGDLIVMTKFIGIGILTTAMRKKLIEPSDEDAVIKTMTRPNFMGPEVARYVSAMTDITGFGLLGHLCEICRYSNVFAAIEFNCIPLLHNVEKYYDHGCLTGGGKRNKESYDGLIKYDMEKTKIKKIAGILFDPQTSGGLLMTVNETNLHHIARASKKFDENFCIIGVMDNKNQNNQLVSISF